MRSEEGNRKSTPVRVTRSPGALRGAAGAADPAAEVCEHFFVRVPVSNMTVRSPNDALIGLVMGGVPGVV